MIFTQEVEVEIDSADVLERVDTEDLIAELRSRDEFPGDLDAERVYDLLVLKKHDDVIREITDFIQFRTGRIVP